MPTHNKLVEYQVGGARITYTADSVTGDGEVAYDGTLAPSATNIEIDLAFPYLKVKACCLYASTATAVKTNSTGGTDVFNLAAGEQLTWTENEAAVCPFTADVTKFYATNSSGTNSCTLKIYVLLDVTP